MLALIALIAICTFEKKPFHSSIGNKKEAEENSQTTVVASRWLSHSKMNLNFYFLHRQCSCGMCSVIIYLSSVSPGGSKTVLWVQVKTDNRFVLSEVMVGSG